MVVIKRGCVVIGDSGVGKTTFIATATNESIYFRECPKLSRTGNTGQQIDMVFVDTPGGDLELEYARLRPLIYYSKDICLMMFSLVDRNSFQHIRDKWQPEIGKHNPRLSKILVGSKLDLRNESADEIITYEEGQSMAEEIDARGYIECSSVTMEGLNEIVDLVFTFERVEIPTKKCCFL